MYIKTSKLCGIIVNLGAKRGLARKQRCRPLLLAVLDVRCRGGEMK